MHNTISFMQEGELVAIGVVVERLGAHCTLDAPQRSAPSLVPIVRSFSTVLDGGMNSIDNRERESYFVAKSYLHIDITNVSDSMARSVYCNANGEDIKIILIITV